MLQDQIVKPPDSMGQQQQQMAPPSSSTASGDRRSKPNTSSAQVLKCPRCDSLNTKFCYYNNYSLTQPRHFCKNCRRYWTQGGALRNVPVGGGCRKNKRVKQRTLDPGALVPMVDHDSMFLNRSAAAAAAGAGSCSALLHSFGGGYGDQHGGLSPTAGNHSHVLSMAFSRLQESFRLGEQQSAGMSSSAAGLYPGMGTQTSSGLLSLINNIQQQPQAAYDNGLLYGSGVKSEPGAQLVYTGSELGAGGGGAIYDGCHVSVGSATATLASIEDQLSSFGGHVDHHQHHPHAALRNGGGYEAQMMQSKAQQLGLHLHSDGSDRNHFTEDEEEHHGQYHHHHHHHHHHHQQQQQQHDHHAEHAGKAGKWTSMMGGMHQPQLAMPNVAQDTWTPHPPAMPESLYDASTSADQEPQNLNFWNHTGWADVHPLAAASSAASTLL